MSKQLNTPPPGGQERFYGLSQDMVDLYSNQNFLDYLSGDNYTGRMSLYDIDKLACKLLKISGVKFDSRMMKGKYKYEEQFGNIFHSIFITHGLSSPYYHYRKHVLDEINRDFQDRFVAVPTPQEYFNDARDFYQYFIKYCINTFDGEYCNNHTGEIERKFGEHCYELGFYINFKPKNGTNSLFDIYHIKSGWGGIFDINESTGNCKTFLYNLHRKETIQKATKTKWRYQGRGITTLTLGCMGRPKEFKWYFLS